MRKKLGMAVVASLALTLLVTGTAAAGLFMKESRAVDLFDRLGVTYQRHLTPKTFSDVKCERSSDVRFECAGRWKVTAVSDEGVLTRFTFKAKGSVTRSPGAVVAKAQFVKWETVDGVTRRTSSVPIKATYLKD